MSTVELIHACAEPDDAAWEEFVSRFRRPITLSIIRTTHQWDGAPTEVVDELVQETYLKLCVDKCRLLSEFAAGHPEAASGYIKTIAANVTHDYFKSLHSQRRGAGQVQQLPEGADPGESDLRLGSAARMEREILLKQIECCLDACSAGRDEARDRLIFRLYYRQGMTANDIAGLPHIGLTTKGVESAIFRLTRLVRQELAVLRSSPSDGQQVPKGFRQAESY